MHPLLSSLDPTTLILLGTVGLAELVLNVVALVSLYRRPASEVTLPSKWIWVLIILLVNFVGAILYFAVGRKPAPASDPRVAPGATQPRSASEIADSLYGKDGKAPNP